jgi:hypothetical protein
LAERRTIGSESAQALDPTVANFYVLEKKQPKSGRKKSKSFVQPREAEDAGRSVRDVQKPEICKGVSVGFRQCGW